MPYYISLMIVASVLAFAAWMVIFQDQRRLQLLATSIWLFAFPILFFVLDNYVLGLLAAVPYFFFIVFEETLKIIASRIARNAREAFGLVLLFGLWEISITKTIGVLFQEQSFYKFLDSNYDEYSVVVFISLLMHSTTAAIYALLRNNNWLIPFSLAFAMHLVFNFTRDFYFREHSGQVEVNFSFILGDAVFFALAWLALWKFYRRALKPPSAL